MLRVAKIMGYATDIFFSEPPASSCICAICHDVLKDASSLSGCGHTFCDECINMLRLTNNPSCPNCRVAITSPSNPNYVVRDIIDTMKVRCPNGTGCGWSGQINDLPAHEKACLLPMYRKLKADEDRYERKLIECREEAAALMRHMELTQGRRMFEVGDYVDARDSAGKWYEAVVREIKNDTIKVHYFGWGSKWDAELPIKGKKKY